MQRVRAREVEGGAMVVVFLCWECISSLRSKLFPWMCCTRGFPGRYSFVESEDPEGRYFFNVVLSTSLLLHYWALTALCSLFASYLEFHHLVGEWPKPGDIVWPTASLMSIYILLGKDKYTIMKRIWSVFWPELSGVTIKNLSKEAQVLGAHDKITFLLDNETWMEIGSCDWNALSQTSGYVLSHIAWYLHSHAGQVTLLLPLCSVIDELAMECRFCCCFFCWLLD